MNHLTSRIILLLTLTLLAGGSLQADQLHYNDIIIGDRAAGRAGLRQSGEYDPAR